MVFGDGGGTTTPFKTSFEHRLILQGMKVKRICIFSIPRTGTNNLCKLLNSIEGLRSHFELFHSNSVYTLDPDELRFINGELGTHYEDIGDPALITFARSNPGSLLEMLETENAEKYDFLSFKIFPFHLTSEVLERDIISHRDTYFILIRRHLIDCYISLRKAEELGAYLSSDTSRLSIELDASEYIRWCAQMLAWYTKCQSLLHKYERSFATLSYERDLSGSKESTVRNFVNAVNSLGANLLQPQLVRNGFAKQDTATEYEQKVANWRDFLLDLSELGVLPH